MSEKTTLKQKDLYGLKPGTRIEAEVVTKYTAVAYERYDGAVGYLVSKNGIEQGSNSPSGLNLLSPEWTAVLPEEIATAVAKDTQVLQTAIEAVEAKTRAKTTPKAKAEPK